MNLFLILTSIIFLGLDLNAFPRQCVSLFETRVESIANPVNNLRPFDQMSQSEKIKSLEDKLKNYFQKEWSTADKLSDAYAARQLLLRLSARGTHLDLEIFNQYVEIFRACDEPYFVREPGFYVDLNMGSRPKTALFQERHFDWNIVDNYFFNSPTHLDFVKNKNLDYLKFVAQFAKQKKQSMKKTLIEANSAWTTKDLANHPNILSAFQSYSANKSYPELYINLRRKTDHWIAQGQTEAIKKQRKEMVQFALDSFKNSNSIFDLYIFCKKASIKSNSFPSPVKSG